MERTTTIVEGGTGNVTMFPSNYNPTQLFVAVNDQIPSIYDEDTVTSSILMNRDQIVELIAALAKQLAYIEEQERIQA